MHVGDQRVSRAEMIIFLLRYMDGADIQRLADMPTVELRTIFVRLKSAKLKLINDRRRFMAAH